MTEVIWLRGEAGAVCMFALPLHEAIQHRLGRGDLVQVNEDGTPWAEDDPALMREASEDDEMLPPKRTASQAEWAAYAVAQGMDPGEAAGMKRDELYKQYRRVHLAAS